MLSGFEAERVGGPSLRRGAAAYLEKGLSPSEMVSELVDVMRPAPVCVGCGAEVPAPERGSSRCPFCSASLPVPAEEELARDRRASNEEMLRAANERMEIFTQASRAYTEARDMGFVCECGRIGCTAIVPITSKRYKEVRDSQGRFVVVAGHESEGDERVLERTDDYCVVQRMEAGAARP